MIIMVILVFVFGMLMSVLSVAMVLLANVLTAAAIIFAVLNFLVMLALVIVLAVLTKKGKFGRDFLNNLKLSPHGVWKYWAMRILQVALWIAAVWSFIVMTLCILCAVMKPLDFLIVDSSSAACAVSWLADAPHGITSF